MSVIFLLGPGMWDPDKKKDTNQNPMQIRRELAAIFRKDGHTVI